MKSNTLYISLIIKYTVYWQSKMCVNLNSLAELIIRETIHVDIVLVWLLPLLKQKNNFIFINSVTKKESFFQLTLNTLFGTCLI